MSVPGLPFLGNILDIDLDNGTMSTLKIAKTYCACSVQEVDHNTEVVTFGPVQRPYF